MALLFIDSTYDLSLGLLNDKFEWLGFRHFKGQKASAVLQKEAHELLQENGIKVKDLSGIISAAGPGFYTGLRLSEGFADVFKAFGIPAYSLYSYEIPKLLGTSSGVWMTKAYRGEYFFHHWDNSEGKDILVSAKELSHHCSNLNSVFVPSDSALDELALGLLPIRTSTQEIIKGNPALLRKVVENQWRRESFYFRAPEDEFRVNP